MLLKHFEILTGGVEDLDRMPFTDQGPDPIPIKFCKRVDTHGPVGSRHLKQAESGEKGPHPFKFCIYTEPRSVLCMRNPGIQMFLAIYPKGLSVQRVIFVNDDSVIAEDRRKAR
jgi:hypothetical protein